MTFSNIISHAHGVNCLNITQRGCKRATGLGCLEVGFLQFFTGGFFVHKRQYHHNDSGKNGRHAEPRVKHEHDKNIDGEPRRIKKRKQTLPGKKLPQVDQIGNWLAISNRVVGKKRLPEGCFGDPWP